MVKIDKLIRSKRKSLGLEITPDARLIVRAPLKISLSDIKKLLLGKLSWIREKQKIAREKHLASPSEKFSDMEEFLYVGESYPLVILENSECPLSFNKGFQLVRDYLPSAQKLFIEWYKKQAYSKIKERLDFYSNLSGYTYRRFAVSDAQKRWGSCSSKGNIHINWRLIMAPLNIIDYVVIHELVHLKERNHSKKFWDKVKIIRSDYKQRRKWLKENGHILMRALD